MKPDDLQQMIFAPPAVGTYTYDEIVRRMNDKTPGIITGIQGLDAVMQPLRPGQLCTVIGRPSHYKSGLAQWWAKGASDRLQGSDEAVIYVTTEMSIEELGMYDLARATGFDVEQLSLGKLTESQLAKVAAKATQRGVQHLWLLGHSAARPKARVRLSINSIEQALLWIEEKMHFKPRMVVLDYLNLLDCDRDAGRITDLRVDLNEVVRSAKDMALAMQCGVVLLAQAHRRCDVRDWPAPQMADAKETSAIEEYSDKMLSVCLPKVYGLTSLEQGRMSYPVPPEGDLLILSLLKQKGGEAGARFFLQVDYGKNTLRPYPNYQPSRRTR
jgi:replicative DNA helicase